MLDYILTYFELKRTHFHEQYYLLVNHNIQLRKEMILLFGVRMKVLLLEDDRTYQSIAKKI